MPRLMEPDKPRKGLAELNAIKRSTCVKCGTLQDSSAAVCQKCGFYARLNTYVELEDYDRLDGDESQKEELIQVPTWVWALIACCSLVFIQSITVALVFEPENPDRSLWALYQLILGTVVFLVVHLRWLVPRILDDDYNMLDCIINPLNVWIPLCKALPKTRWWVVVGSSGLLATIMALFVIRVVTWDEIWGEVPERKRTLVQAIAEQAKTNQPGTTVEGALQEVAGEEKENQTDEGELEFLDCVIIGYHANDTEQTGALSSIVAANLEDGKLKMLGNVSEGLSLEDRESLLVRLQELEVPDPFIHAEMTANWVKPIILCRVKCRISPEGVRTSLKFNRLLLELPAALPFMQPAPVTELRRELKLERELE